MGSPVELNRPDILAEVTKAYLEYDAALRGNDVATLNAFFVDSELATRFGLGQELYGAQEITAWRRAAPPLVRNEMRRYNVVTINDDTAVVTAQWDEDDVVGRQSQTWVRTEAGWQVLSGHVSTRARTSA